MNELILHHYPGSPFAEKVRLILGFKGLAWTSVLQPAVMPKPELTALTGGYRRIPVLQVGADVYCDSALIARRLEQVQPSPTLFPASAPLAPVLAQWADSTLFWTAIPFTMRPDTMAHVFAGQPPEAVKAFSADRAAMTAGMRRISSVDALAQLPPYLAALDAQLADGRTWLFGSAPCIADFSVAHCLWFSRRAPVVSVFDPHPALKAWLERVLAIGHGVPLEMDSAEAAIQRLCDPACAVFGVETFLMRRDMSLAYAPRIFGLVWVISAGMTAVGYMAQKSILAPPPADAPEGAGPVETFLSRLPLKFRQAELHAVSSEDHYLRVHTSLGEELILMRLADAVRELDGGGGLQVHRSWWVAKAAVRDVKRQGGKVSLVLPSSKEAPVSRTFTAEVKAAGLL